MTAAYKRPVSLQTKQTKARNQRIRTNRVQTDAPRPNSKRQFKQQQQQQQQRQGQTGKETEKTLGSLTLIRRKQNEWTTSIQLITLNILYFPSFIAFLQGDNPQLVYHQIQQFFVKRDQLLKYKL